MPVFTRQKFTELSRRLEARLFATGQAAAPTAKAATGIGLSTAQERRGARKRFHQLLAVLASIAFFSAFVYSVIYYQSTGKRIGEQQLVRNLAKDVFQAKIRFGPSPICAGGIPCWSQADFSDATWTSARLPLDPSTNIKSLPDYRTGLATNSMYYRLRVPVADDLVQGAAEISFAPGSIQHHYYEVYLSGRHVYSSNGDGVLGQIVNLPIQRPDIKQGYATVVIHASVLPQDVGLAHYSDVFVGPKPVLDNIYVFQERSFFTYYLLFLLSKGSVFVIFALFFIYTKGQRGMQYFLIYAFFTTLENIFIGEFFGESLSLRLRALAFHGCKTLSTVGLLGFFVTYFNMRGSRRWYHLTAIVATLAMTLMCLDFGWWTGTVGFAQMRLLNRIYLLATLAFAALIGNLLCRSWKRVDKAAQRYRDLRSFCYLLSAYIVFDVWIFFFTPFTGFDVSAVLDLLLFYFIALISARDFGTKEGRIETLEGHMAEKYRMEQELQSAAEIARAFLPDRVPEWQPYLIDAFHKPLTENSGDWYAFERADSGNLYHFLMCDITGHGVQAALVVSTCKAVLSSMIFGNRASFESPDFIIQFAKALNAILFANGHGSHVSTLLGVSFEPGRNLAHYFSAGHPPPLQIINDKFGHASPRPLVTRNKLLGTAPTYTGEMGQVSFGSGDEIITYTDGLAANSHIKVLRSFLRERQPGIKAAAENLYKTILAVETTKKAHAQDDDVSIVWFKAS